MDRIDKPEPSAHKIARQDESDGTGGNSDQKFEHKAVLDRVSAWRYSTERWPERFSSWKMFKLSTLWYANRERFRRPWLSSFTSEGAY
jgi:hypothetical protein